MKFSYNWLNSFFDKDLPEPDKLAEKLMMRFFEVEKVKPMDGDFLIDIDVLPNRASDCFSHFGVAKEIAAIYNLDINELKSSFKEGKTDLEKQVDVKVETDLTRRYMLTGLTEVKVGETPNFIKKRLKVCGLQSINNIVDITNYVMLETGQPLHAFDGEKVGSVIKVRKAKNGEKITTLDGDLKELDGSMIVIADKNDPIGIAGIKGGQGPEIDKDTNVIYLEAANFDAKTIRKTSKKLKLRTDASSRFAHGLDPQLAKEATERAIYLLQKYASGSPMRSNIDKYSDPIKPKNLKLSLEKTRSLLGVDISKSKVVEMLDSLSFEVEEDGDFLEVVVPTKRRDVSLEEDLIEEIGRIYGYENIEPTPPKAAVTTPKPNNSLLWEDKIRDILKEVGFVENYNYTFINEKVKEIFGYEDLIEMENPVSSEYKYLRPELLPLLLKNIKNNEKRSTSVDVFEIGKTFSGEEGKMIGAATTSQNFRELKGVIDLVVKKVTGETPEYENDLKTWSTEKAAQISLNGEVLGYLGEVKYDLLKELKINSKPLVFQMNFEKLVSLAVDEHKYEKIVKFPVSVKDISILIPEEVAFKKVISIVQEAAGSLLTDVDLFDLYQGDGVPEGVKSLGLRLSFQAKDRTLSKKEINNLLEKIISSLEESGWEVRKK